MKKKHKQNSHTVDVCLCVCVRAIMHLIVQHGLVVSNVPFSTKMCRPFPCSLLLWQLV